MFFTIIKKEFKELFRTKGLMILLFLFPLMLITTLSLGLGDLMNDEVKIFGENDETSIVYYSLEDTSMYKDGFESFTTAIEEQLNISFKKVSSLNAVQSEVDDYKAIAYVAVGQDNFQIYTSSKGENMMIISKVTMGVIIGTMQTLLVYVYSSFVLKVNWSENALKYMLLYIALALFASMIGAIVGIVSKNDTAVSGILFVVTFAFSILGGCCSTREMITSIPFINKLAYISPIYWINTAINIMICNFKSNLYIIALLVPVVLSIIIFIIYIIIMKKRGEALDVWHNEEYFKNIISKKKLYFCYICFAANISFFFFFFR